MLLVSKILIVEDDGIIAAQLQDTLTGLGYTVLGPVESGEAALAAVKAQPPELVLMDIKLAGALNGIQAYRSIREFTFVPVVFMTAYGTPQIKAEVASCTPLDFLEKPLPQLRLMEVIKHYKATYGEPIEL